MKDEETTPLVSTSANANPTTQYTNFAKITLSGIIVIILIVAIAINHPTNVENISNSFSDLGNVYGHKFFKETSRNDNGDIIFLDRHSVDCGNDPLRGFRAGDRITYECYTMKVMGPLNTYSSDTGFNSNGNIKFLNRHKAYCNNDYLMSYWKLVSSWGNVKIDFTCRRYAVKSYHCEDRYTDFNDPNGGIRNLDRHWVMCRDDEALKGFEGQTGCWDRKWWGCEDGFRWKYVCCSADSYDPTPQPIARPTHHPVSSPTLKPTENPTDSPTYHPSPIPSQYPVADPTLQPTLNPTQNPTENPTFHPTLSPTVKSTDNPTAKPTTGHPSAQPTVSPTHKPSLEPVVLKGNMCTYEFVKGKTSAEVSPGCALITGEDIDKMLPGQDTHALYVCATRDVSAYLNKQLLVEYGMEGDQSYIFPGRDTDVIMYSDDNFQGSKVYNDGIKAFIGNQNVNSLVVQSIVDYFELKAECNKKK